MLPNPLLSFFETSLFSPHICPFTYLFQAPQAVFLGSCISSSYLNLLLALRANLVFCSARGVSSSQLILYCAKRKSIPNLNAAAIYGMELCLLQLPVIGSSKRHSGWSMILHQHLLCSHWPVVGQLLSIVLLYFNLLFPGLLNSGTLSLLHLHPLTVFHFSKIKQDQLTGCYVSVARTFSHCSKSSDHGVYPLHCILLYF